MIQYLQFLVKRISISVIFILSWAAFLPVEAQPALSPKISHIIQDNKARNAFWAITVRDSTGTILQAHNSQKLVRPASNLKLLTSAAVLEELGADFTYTTYLYGRGHQQDSVWNGDIIIRGRGDPSISGTFYNDDRLHVMDEFYRNLKRRGITHITGNLVGNDAYFDSKPYPDGWSWNDLTYYYAVPINALSFNNNTVDLTVYASGRVGSTPSIEWFPFDTDYVNFVNQQEIAPRITSYDEHYKRVLGTNTIILGSRLSQGYIEKEALSIANPPLFFMDTFKKYISDGGIRVEGGIAEDDQPHRWRSQWYKKLGVHHSPPLGELIKQLNKHSDNFYAEMLLKTAAAEYYDTRGTTDLGVMYVKNFAKSIGIDSHQLSLSDGSGMSSRDLISTGVLSTILVQMQRKPDFSAFKNSLPIAGVDGSLEHRFTRPPLKRHIFAKTGYVSGVRSLSGYLQTKSDKKLIFSMVTNNYTTSTSYIDSIQHAILTQLYNRY